MYYGAILALIVGLMFAIPAFAGQSTIEWTNATQDVDGATLPTTGDGALASTRVEWGTCATTGTAPTVGTEAGERVVAMPATTAVVTGLANGSTVCFRAVHLTVGGLESGVSNIVAKVVPFPRPRPPVLR
jgi:hypothetical protein